LARCFAEWETQVFRSADEKATERRRRDAEYAREEAAREERGRVAEEERRRAAFLATPVGAAMAAFDAGQEFFEVQLEVGAHTGTASFGSAQGQRSTSSSAVVLGDIEQVGWRLEHASYLYMVTGETSTKKVLISGDQTVVSGVTVGVYLFRRAS
jgi:hypothetical protein